MQFEHLKILAKLKKIERGKFNAFFSKKGLNFNVETLGKYPKLASSENIENYCYFPCTTS